MEITNIGTQGYPGVGKKSVLDLAIWGSLMIDSTTKGVEWEIVTTDKIFKLVCEAMKTIEDMQTPRHC